MPEWSNPNDPRHEISLRNLLHMSSGLEWSESYDFSDQTSDIIQMFSSPSVGAYVANKPLVSPPGTRWRYSTGTSNLIARILAQETDRYGSEFEAFMFERLFTPLGIENVKFGFDSTGVWFGGSAANMATRDFARLGLLYLRGGEWNGTQLLSESWVDFVRTPAPSTSRYGAHFWVDRGEPGRFDMVGINGQRVLLAPDLDLVVAANHFDGDSRAVAQIFESAAVPSCTPLPVASSDSATLAPSESRIIDVTSNDAGSGEALALDTLTIVSGPDHGTAMVDNGTITYANTSGIEGTDVFSYEICNVSQICGEAAVTVTLAVPNPVDIGGVALTPAARCSRSPVC